MHFFVKIIPKELPGLTNEITVICTINTMRTEALPGGSHVACLNVKTSCVGVYKINACRLLSALPSLSQFGRGRLSLVVISSYLLSLIFGPRHQLEFTLTGPQDCPGQQNTTVYALPLFPNIHKQILQNARHTFSYRIIQENLIKDQTFPLAW